MEYIDKRIDGNVDVTPKSSLDLAGSSEKYIPYNEDTKTGILHIEGSLTYKPTGWEALCGGTSYVSLKEQMEYFVDQGAKTVAMIVDSGGGMAYSMIDTANYIRKLADDNDIKIIAMVDGISASAAYGLTVIADEIVSTSSAMQGSVGVLIQLMNNSKALEKEGYDRTFIVSNEGKIPYDKNGSFREGFLEGLQEQVDTLYEEFTSHVAQHRNLPQSDVKATDARVFMASESLQLGLIDKIMSIDEFYDYLASIAQNNLEGNEMGNPLKNLINMKTNEENTDMTQLADLQAQLQSKDAELSALAEKVEAFASMEGLFAEAKAALAAKEVELSTAIEKVQAMETQAKEAKELARKEKLASVVAQGQVEGLVSSMASLDDAAFATVVGAMAASAKAVQESEMFTEVGDAGVTASTEEAATPKTSTTDELIKARLQNR